MTDLLLAYIVEWIKVIGFNCAAPFLIATLLFWLIRRELPD